MRPRASLPVVAGAAAVLLSAAAAGSVPRLRLIDDRGRAIETPIKVCLYRGLETSCLEQPPYAIPASLRDFGSLTAEGPEHGPLEVKRAEIAPNPNGEYVVSVRRKALLTVANLPHEPLTLSLYHRDDANFRKPAFRFERIAATGIRIPAQGFVLSLSDGRRAPDLQFLSAEPGRKHSISYHSRPGWSLLFRCVAAGAKAPISRADGALLSASTPGTERELGRALTERDGLGMALGISEPFATLAVSADGYLKQAVRGVTAGAGTFGFREVFFERGGNVKATVTLDGEPATGALCQLVSTRAKRSEGKRASDVLFEARVSRDGACETARVSRGDYILRVIPAGSKNSDDSMIIILEDRTQELEVKLRRYDVRGTVRRGEKPEVGAVVWVENEEDAVTSPSGRNAPPEPLKAKTDEEGRYHGYVWRQGRYDFTVANTAGMAAAQKTVEVTFDGATVDFQLNGNDISGVVLDEDDSPVAEAWVNLILDLPEGGWQTRYGSSDANGRFRYSLEGGGHINLKAGKDGYRKAEPLDLTIVPDADVPPITIVLQRLDTIEGRVLSPSGGPAPAVGVATYQAPPARAPTVAGSVMTDADGHFSAPKAPGPATRVFVMGLGCPLQIADVVADDQEKIFPCSAVSSGLEITIKKADGTPVQDEYVLLRWNGVLIPRMVLNSHLTFLGMPIGSDGGGRLTLVGLPPGDYDVFLLSSSSEATISEGLKYGFVSTVHLQPLEIAEIAVEVQF